MKKVQGDRNFVLEKSTPLSKADKARFAYFGVGAKIRPPFRILNPQRIVIGDRTSIREGANIYAFCDLTLLLDYIDVKYRGDFNPDDYRYEPQIRFGEANQVGRLFFMSCTNAITLEDYVLLSERVFIGDNNHAYSHPHVPIMQQPNQKGRPVVIGRGTWVGVGAAILAGTRVGRNCVIGANSVCRGGDFPAHSVIGQETAKVLFQARAPRGADPTSRPARAGRRARSPRPPAASS